MGQRLIVCSEVNRLGEPEGNRVLTGRKPLARVGGGVAGNRPETRRSIHGQGEG